VVDLPKLILLATGFSVDVVTSAPTLHRDVPTKVFVKGLTLATIIGVNPPEARSETTGHHQYSIPRKTVEIILQ